MAKKKTAKRKETAVVLMLDEPKDDTCYWTVNGETAAMFGKLGTERASMVRRVTKSQAQEIVKQIHPKAKTEKLPHIVVNVTECCLLVRNAIQFGQSRSICGGIVRARDICCGKPSKRTRSNCTTRKDISSGSRQAGDACNGTTI